jgi:hypothetical protein
VRIAVNVKPELLTGGKRVGQQGLALPAFGEDVRPLLQRNFCPLGVVIQ